MKTLAESYFSTTKYDTMNIKRNYTIEMNVDR